MKKIYLFTVLALLLSLGACQTPEVDQKERVKSPRKPKTSYGQAVERSREVSKSLSAHDRATSDQARDLLDE